MGTWGAGNFDDDSAGDFLAALTHKLLDDTKAAMANPAELEPDEPEGVLVPCRLQILTLFAQQRWVGVALPSRAEAEGWKTRFMAVWEDRIDGLDPAPGHKDARRRMLESTFDDLIAACTR